MWGVVPGLVGSSPPSSPVLWERPWFQLDGMNAAATMLRAGLWPVVGAFVIEAKDSWPLGVTQACAS